MLRSCVTISLVSEARGGPFVFWDDLDSALATAKKLEFDAVELFLPSPTALRTNELKHKLETHGLALAAVGTGAGWVLNGLNLTAEEAGDRSDAIGFVRSMIDFGASFGAPAIIGSMQGRAGDAVPHDLALNYLAESLSILGLYARQQNVPLFYEPLNRYETNLVNTIDDGVELLREVSNKNVKLLADWFHMNIEEVDLAAAIRSGGDAIGHIHFVDTNRRAVGSGHLDVKPIADAVKEIGFDGYISAEALPLPDSQTAAKMTIAAFRKWFAA